MTYEITKDHLKDISGVETNLLEGLAKEINRVCPQFEIDTKQEMAHFLAQACHETDHFRTLREYASGADYEGRKDLGNVQSGDGRRFKGRGIFQTTGRSNYKQLGVVYGKPNLFIKSPELLETPEYAVWSACVYWKTRSLNNIAIQPDSNILKKKYRGSMIDVSPVEYISIAINGGKNGLEQRKKFYQKALEVLPDVKESTNSQISFIDGIFEAIHHLTSERTS